MDLQCLDSDCLMMAALTGVSPYPLLVPVCCHVVPERLQGVRKLVRTLSLPFGFKVLKRLLWMGKVTSVLSNGSGEYYDLDDTVNGLNKLVMFSVREGDYLECRGYKYKWRFKDVTDDDG